MGADHSRVKSKIRKMAKKMKEKQLINQIFCPFCNMGFNSDEPIIFNTHIRSCGIAKIKIKKACDLFPPGQDLVLNQSIFKNIKDYNKSIIKSDEKEKISFDKKISDLKTYINLKKNKTLTYCLSINRENLLNEVLDKVEGINLYQNWKIEFIGEKSYNVGCILF